MVGSQSREKTLWWEDGIGKTVTLRFTMLDSPKDDFLEKNNIIVTNAGQKLRLHFLAGKNNAESIAGPNGESMDSPGYYGQVLGFPYIEIDATENEGVLTPFQVKQAGVHTAPFVADEYGQTN